MDNNVYTSPSEGIGDTVAKVLHFTGVDKVVDFVTDALEIEDCGCNKRREMLNSILPYKKKQPKEIEITDNYVMKNGRKIKVYS